MPDRTFRLRKILVATDFSADSTAALRQAVDLADRSQAELTLAHVLEDVASAVPGTTFEAHWHMPPAELHKAERKLRQQAAERLDGLLEAYRSGRRKLRSETFVGVPFVEIIRAVQKKRYDLVVAGTRGLTGVKRFLVGSTAERLVRKCPCPVWIVKATAEGPPRSLLVPVDFSEVSGKSLQLAGWLAGQFNSSLNVLHVLTAASDIIAVPTDPARREFRQQRRAVRYAAAQRLTELIGTHVPSGVKVTELLATGTPWERIGLVARRSKIDLIVMGSVGRTGVPGFLIGNTAEKVLRQGSCSLLTVKPESFVSPVQPTP